ncbi:unnamed protein product, partial [Rhizoctonia solani]
NSIVPNRLSHLWQDGHSSVDGNGRTISQLGPWEGETKISIAIDIGTTYSGVAFTFLQKGSSPVIHRVTRWPGQEAHQQQSKIPTLIWYDTTQKAVAFGAEAQLDEIKEQVEDNEWFLAKHFKLHLHPDNLKAKHDLKLDALPPGVNLEQIYSDFLRYLLKHTKAYFEDRVLDGKKIWEKYSDKMEVVLAHPNGWYCREQSFLRSAAVVAGLAGEDTASSRIRFVTEAEAAVHFCIHNANMKNVLKTGTNFGVCDDARFSKFQPVSAPTCSGGNRLARSDCRRKLTLSCRGRGFLLVSQTSPIWDWDDLFESKHFSSILF